MINSTHGYNPEFYAQAMKARRSAYQTDYMRRYNRRKREERARREHKEPSAERLLREKMLSQEATLIRRLVSIPATSMDTLIHRVTSSLNVDMDDIFAKKKRKTVATDAIRLISYFGFKIASSPEIGKALNRNHASILLHVSSMPKIAMKRHQIELERLR